MLIAVGTILNMLACFIALIGGMSVEDDEAPKGTGWVCFVLWALLEVLSIVLLVWR